MRVMDRLIPDGHPNRPGTKRESFGAIVFHYTANDRPGATDTMNADYFGRKYYSNQFGKVFEADGITPFRYGSTHILCDQDSVTRAIPTDEACWGCGDRNFGEYTTEWKGQQKLARLAFDNRQNCRTVNIEICNNADWAAACANARDWAAEYLAAIGQGFSLALEASLGREEVKAPLPGRILLLRHYDLTGKVCPRPFVDGRDAWMRFVSEVGAKAKALGVRCD